MTTKPLDSMPGATQHRAWVKPSVRKIRAGDAENAPNGNAPDGRFSRGGS